MSEFREFLAEAKRKVESASIERDFAAGRISEEEYADRWIVCGGPDSYLLVRPVFQSERAWEKKYLHTDLNLDVRLQRAPTGVARKTGHK